MNVNKGRVKLFPNVWQALFFKNYTVQKANVLFGEKEAYFKNKAEEYFETYQKKYIENVKVIESYTNQLFNTKTVHIIAEEILENVVKIYPISGIEKLKEFLKKRKIERFPKTLSLPTIGPNDRWNVDKGELQLFENISFTNGEMISIILFGFLIPKEYTVTSKIQEKAVSYFNEKNRDLNIKEHTLQNGMKFYGCRIDFEDKKGNILHVYGRRKYEDYIGKPIVLERKDKQTIIPFPPSSLEIPKGEFSQNIEKEMKHYKYNLEPMITSFSLDQRIKQEFGKKALAQENAQTRKKMRVLYDLRKEIEQANRELQTLNIERSSNIILEQQKNDIENEILKWQQELNRLDIDEQGRKAAEKKVLEKKQELQTLKLKAEKMDEKRIQKLEEEKSRKQKQAREKEKDIILYDLEDLKKTSEKIRRDVVPSLNVLIEKIKNEPVHSTQKLRIKSMDQFIERIEEINQTHFEENLKNISLDSPLNAYRIAFRLKEDLINLINELRNAEGMKALVQRTLYKEEVEVMLERCAKRAQKFVDNLQNFGIVQQI